MYERAIWNVEGVAMPKEPCAEHELTELEQLSNAIQQ